MRPLARFVRYLDSGLRRYLGSIKVPIPELDGLSTVAKSAYGAALNGDGSVTTFHQCFREMVGLEAAGVLPVHNYIQLIAQSMGLPYEDEYKAWKRAPDDAKEMIGAERIAKVGIEFYERAILPELKKLPTVNK